MISSDYIMNGTKSKKSKGLFYMPGTSNLDIGMKTKPIRVFKNTSQKKYLKMTTGMQTRRFFDNDKDGVINGLDCFSRDSSRHGPITWLQEKYASYRLRRAERQTTPSKEYGPVKYRSIDERSEEQRAQEIEERKVNLERIQDKRDLEKQTKYAKQYLQEGVDEESKKEKEELIKKRKELMEKESMQRAIQNQEVDKWNKGVKEEKKREEGIERKKFFGEAYIEEKEEKERKIRREKQEKITYLRKRKKEYESAETITPAKRKKINEWDERIKDLHHSIDERDKRPEPGLYGKAKANVGEIYKDTKRDIKYGAHKMFGHIFQEEGARKEMRRRDLDESIESDIALGYKLSDRLSPDDYKKYQGRIDKLKNIYNNKDKGPKLSDTQKRDLSGRTKTLLKEIKRGSGDFDEDIKRKKIQERQQSLYALRNIGLSKLTMEKTKLERARLSEYKQHSQSSGSGGSSLSGFMFGGSQQQPQQFGRSEPQQTTEYKPMFDLPKPTSSHFDPEAPKFVYRRKVGAKSRKSARFTSKSGFGILNQPEMKIDKKGKIVKETQMGKRGKYPSTKPMIGWERIYVGKGRAVGKGRKKKTKFGADSLFKDSPFQEMTKKTKAKPLGFSPFVKTYKWK